MREAEIKTQICEYLTRSNVFYMKLNSGMVKSGARYIYLCPTGTADLILFLGERVAWIEMKQLKGVQRKSQVEFQAKVEAAGHPYLVARSVEDVANWLKENGAL